MTPDEEQRAAPAAAARPAARAAARVIDAVILAGLAFGGLLIVFLATFCIWCSSHQTDSGQVTLGILVLVGCVLYEPVGIAWRGQTFGKAICRIRVVRAADGATPNMGQAIMRWAIPAAAGVIPFVAAVSLLASNGLVAIGAMIVAWAPMYLTSFADADRLQGWHDKAARTVVVSTDRSS